MNLTAKVLIAMLLGISVGLIINVLNVEVFDNSLLAEGAVLNEYVINGFFHIVGKMFVNALKMLVVPLVLFSLICGVCGIGDIKLLGRIGSKCFVLYLFTTAVAIASAIGVAATIGIGDGIENNSHNLVLQNWRGVWIDSNIKVINKLFVYQDVKENIYYIK